LDEPNRDLARPPNISDFLTEYREIGAAPKVRARATANGKE